MTISEKDIYKIIWKRMLKQEQRIRKLEVQIAELVKPELSLIDDVVNSTRKNFRDIFKSEDEILGPKKKREYRR